MAGSTSALPGNSTEPDFTTDCVVVGSGPAGGSLAAFLASNGNIPLSSVGRLSRIGANN